MNHNDKLEKMMEKFDADYAKQERQEAIAIAIMVGCALFLPFLIRIVSALGL